MNKHDNEDNKESFCGACLSIPLAMAGTSLSIYGSTKSSKQYRRQKQIIFWIGMIISIIFLIITIYYMRTCTSCKINK